MSLSAASGKIYFNVKSRYSRQRKVPLPSYRAGNENDVNESREGSECEGRVKESISNIICLSLAATNRLRRQRDV